MMLPGGSQTPTVHAGSILPVVLRLSYAMPGAHVGYAATRHPSIPMPEHRYSRSSVALSS
eukprot:309076-Rhodomonas_salina.5